MNKARTKFARTSISADGIVIAGAGFLWMYLKVLKQNSFTKRTPFKGSACNKSEVLVAKVMRSPDMYEKRLCLGRVSGREVLSSLMSKWLLVLGLTYTQVNR